MGAIKCARYVIADKRYWIEGSEIYQRHFYLDTSHICHNKIKSILDSLASMKIISNPYPIT